MGIYFVYTLEGIKHLNVSVSHRQFFLISIFVNLYILNSLIQKIAYSYILNSPFRAFNFLIYILANFLIKPFSEKKLMKTIKQVVR